MDYKVNVFLVSPVSVDRLIASFVKLGFIVSICEKFAGEQPQPVINFMNTHITNLRVECTDAAQSKISTTILNTLKELDIPHHGGIITDLETHSASYIASYFPVHKIKKEPKKIPILRDPEPLGQILPFKKREDGIIEDA